MRLFSKFILLQFFSITLLYAVSYSQVTWTSFTTTDGLVNNFVRAIDIDGSGNLWFGTTGGVSKFDGTTWTTFTTTDGLVNNDVRSIDIDGSGNLWFGTTGGVSKFDGTTWTNFTTTDGLANNTVFAINIDGSENVWFATNGGGVSKFDGTTWTTFTTTDGLVDNTVIVVNIDGSGNLWFGTNNNGVSKFDGTSTWTNFTTTDGLVNNAVRAIDIDGSGNLWFGTTGGVSKFDGTTWTNFTTTDGLANNSVQAIDIDGSGNLWFGTFGGGVSKFDGTTWTNFTTTDGLANNSVQAIDIDGSGNLWFATFGGGVSKLVTNATPSVSANTGLNAVVGLSTTISNQKLKVTDSDNTATELTFTVTIATTNGTLSKSGTTLTTNSTFTQNDIDNSTISYAHDGSNTSSDSFTFTVSDGSGGTISATAFNITIVPVSLSLSSIANVSVTEFNDVSVSPTATYNGVGSLSYSISSNIPSSESTTFSSSTGKFSWSTDVESGGTFSATITVTDGTLSASRTFSIAVAEFDFSENATSIVDTAAVSSSTGGTVTVDPNGIYTKHKATIPAGALQADKTITAGPPDIALDNIPAAQLSAVPSAVSFTVQGNTESTFEFQKSVTLTIEYKDFEVKGNVLEMRIHSWDATLQLWKRVMSTHVFDQVEKTISANVDHFTVFGAIQLGEISESTTLSVDWNMVSLPIDPISTVTPEDVFGDDIDQIKLEDGNSNIYEYNESKDSWDIPTTLVNGKGYILFGFGPSVVDAEGLEVTGDIVNALSSVNGGWNLLGNPYSVAIDWDNDVTLDAGTDNIYYAWTGSQYEFYPGGGLTSTIDPWGGFFVNTSVNGSSLSIDFPGTSKKSRPSRPVIDWRIQFVAESGSAVDTHNYIGISKASVEGHDGLDVYELDPINEIFITAYFSNDQQKHTQDIRSGENSSLQWDMTVETNSTENSVTIAWFLPENLPDDYDIILTDIDAEQDVDMRSRSSYEYATEKSKDLTITLTRKPNRAEVLIPDVYFLEQNYPNPFNPATTIRYGLPESGHVTLQIFNTLGQEIATLVNSDQTAGIKSIVWNGKNNVGRTVSSGIYFYRISAGSFTEIKRLLLVR